MIKTKIFLMMASGLLAMSCSHYKAQAEKPSREVANEPIVGNETGNPLSMSITKLVEDCRDVGVEKVALEVGPAVDTEKVYECGVDSRPFVPSKYVWFCYKMEDGNIVSKLTQKPLMKKCF